MLSICASEFSSTAAICGGRIVREQNLAHQIDALFRLLSAFFDHALGKARAASTHCTSFMVTSACKGVSVRWRRVQTTSRMGASKASMSGIIAMRFQ